MNMNSRPPAESQVEPGFKWSVRLMLTTSVANNTTIPSVAKPLMDALAGEDLTHVGQSR